MTDKEIFDGLKKERKANRRKKRMLAFLKVDTNRKIMVEGRGNEDRYVELLSELRAIEINDIKLRRNKFNSSYYEFTPSNKIRL